MRRILQIPTLVRIGLIAVVALYLVLAIYQAVTIRIAGAADSYGHLDYIWQVFNGHLPDGYGYELDGRRGPSETDRHLTAAHPPLYYALLAPLLGPLLAAGNWELATAIARGINIVFGLGVLVTLAWAGWRLGGRLRSTLVLVVPAIGVLIVPFMRIAGDNYNDVLAILFSTIALTVSCIILREGPSVRWGVILILLSVAGMATRSTYIATLGLSMLALAAAYVMHRPDISLGRRIGRIVGWWAATAVAVIGSIGWFYLRNFVASGSWFRSRPQQPVRGREYHSVLDNLTNIDFYLIVPSRLLGIKQWNGLLPINIHISILVSAVCLVGLIVWLTRGGRWARIISTPSSRAIALLALAQVLALYVMQLQHATGWGNLNPRYLLPGLLVFAFLLALGATAWPQLRGQLAVGIVGILALAGMVDAIWFNERFGFEPSLKVLAAFGAIAVAALVVLSIVLFRITAPRDAITSRTETTSV